MGNVDQELKGPDLKKGIDIDLVKSGQKLLGHADGNPVLLFRENEKIYAVSAKCSHYGADLNEGLIADGTIRCPWHHACFDIKTGEVTKAPAFNPLATWETEVQGRKVYVRAQKPAPCPKTVMLSSDHFVIIGSGAAGHSAAENLRHLNFSGRITILTADSDLPYDRPNLSKDYLAGNAPEEWMPLRSEEFFAEKNIQIRKNVKVAKIESKNKFVVLEDGETLGFSKCLIATGGKPVRPNIVGIDSPHVHFLRSFSDCRSFISGLGVAKKVVIVGAGFIGLEAAAALKARGLDVTIIAPNKFPLEHVLGPKVGAFLKSLHEANGVHFILEQSVEKIEEDRVVLTGKSEVPADLVLVAVGITPLTQFLEGSGVQIENGVLVDEYLETGVKDVFAAGDVARWPSQFSKKPVRIEHWVVAQEQGKIAAANMMGLKMKYAEVPFFWSQQFDVVLNYVGSATSFDDTQIHGSLYERNCAVAYMENDVVKGVLTIGRDFQSLEIERAFEMNDQNLLKKILSGS